MKCWSIECFFRKKILRHFCVLVFSVYGLTSCYTIKNYVKHSTIIVKNVVKKESGLQINPHQNSLISNSYSYIEESVSPKFTKRLPYWYVLKSPPILDSLKIALSVQNMNSYFNSRGYFNHRIHYQVNITPKKEYKKAVVTYLVQFNDPFYINELKYDLAKDVIQKLQNDNPNAEKGLLEGSIFNANELETTIKNIVQIHKELGYYKIKTDDIKAELDTLINVYKTKYKYVNIRFYYNQNIDSNDLKQFIVKEVRFVSNYDNKDTSKITSWSEYRNILYDQQRNIVKPKILWLFNNLDKGSFFTESAYQQNIDNLYRLNIWNVINVKNQIFSDTLLQQKKYVQIGFEYLLEKAPQYSFNVESGLGYNFSPLAYQDINFINQNSWGVNLSSFFAIKNTLSKAIETKFTGRAALESFITTTSFSLSTVDFNFDINQQIPWLFPFKIYKTKNLLFNSGFAIGVRLTERINFYTLKSLNTKLDWSIENPSRNLLLEVKPLYASFVFLDKSARFLHDQAINPYLKYGFNEGITAGISIALTKQIKYKALSNQSSFINLFVEESGSTWASFVKFKDYPIFKYIKFLGTLTHYIKYPKQSWSFRLKGGYGYSYGTDTLINRTLPFFKQFFAGGPNSMRAWNSARLGLGSVPDTTDFKDKYGDIVFETNLEYRFNLLKLNSFKLESCLFVDVGNVWNRVSVGTLNQNSVFQFDKLYKELAVAGGTGIRVVLSFIVVRFDLGLKIKDPIYPLSRQYFNSNNLTFSNIALQLGIGYPF